MAELFIQNVSTWTQQDPNSTAELDALKEVFGKRVARRMTRLGMMVSQVLKDLKIQEHSGLVYATTYSETCAIEKFLDSFPYPSPQGFQTSIHPSGVEQYLIQQKQAIEEYFPLAGGDDLVVRGLDTLQACRSDDLIFCGGEERGTWLKDLSLSSQLNFAWGLELSRNSSSDTMGRIEWDHRGDFTGVFDLLNFVSALAEQNAYQCANAEGGLLDLSWR